MIFSSPSRKRSRDIEDDFELSSQPLGKKSRASTGNLETSSTSSSTQWGFVKSPLRFTKSGDESSFASNASVASSTTEDSMELDNSSMSTFWSPQSPGQITPTTNPSTSWPSSNNNITTTTNDTPMMNRTPRRSDSLLSRPVRPKPYPLQSADPNAMIFSSSALHLHNRTYSSNSLRLSTDRLGSPIDEDEPHTPTTAAGSQLSMLSVNDMDLDTSTPNRETGLRTPESGATNSFIRKQRQRSGAFISSPDVAKRFQMGYREDCEKCRLKVPGHMNHIVQA